jgi:N-acetylglucosaminyldiphosphoundecaprenol N-acetyl-beta-D-mannosaminyltransferase
MPIVATIVGLAALVWGAIYAHRGSLVIGSGVFLVIGYVFGYEYWHVEFGPLPVTLDRLVLVALLAATAIQWRTGRLRARQLTVSDFVVGMLLFVLATSAVLSGQADYVEGATSKWGRLVTSFVLPTLLYFVARLANLTPRNWTSLLAGLVLMGAYLGITAVLEIGGHWSLVFPRHIADADLGIHFGRARGPELNAASLGLYLTACFWCGWTLLRLATRRWQQLAIAITLPLMALGVFFTYTRSTWLGLAASVMLVAALEIPRRWRTPAMAAAVLGGLLIVAAAWSHLIRLEREGTAAESLHSVDQRTSFAYVSWQMFCDHPLFGVGFGRFYDRKLPYLSDRSQGIELESIRPLHHHNTLLSLLTETGLVGFAVYVAMLLVWSRQAWLLARGLDASSWGRAQGLLMLAIMTSYLCSAVFHDLTLIPSQHWLLFAFAGLTESLRQEQNKPMLNCRLRIADCELFSTPIRNPQSAIRNPIISLFGMPISRATMQETIERVLEWCDQPRVGACRYLVTPNVDHAVLFQHRGDLRAAYADASLVLADGVPIVLASRLLGRPLPERVAGSDLIPCLFASTNARLRVYLLGAAPGVADAAARRIERLCNSVQVVGTYSPPLGFENDEFENDTILAAVASAKPDLLIVGLGAPKQELWVHRHRHLLQAKVAICAGATIDFLAGKKQRSPVWMRRTGLEWLHRLWSEPRRLTARYARDAWIFPQLVWREWRHSSG